MATKKQLVEALKDVTDRLRGASDAGGGIEGAREAIERAVALVASEKPRQVVKILTKVENGITYYGKVVNYSTGPRLSWFSFRPDEARVKKILAATRRTWNIGRPMSAGTLYIEQEARL